MNERNITKHLYHHLLWKKWQKIVTHQFTTHFWIADVWSINHKMLSSEFEIKTSKADLMSELEPIRKIMQWETHGDWAKFHKHFKYLTWKHQGSLVNPESPHWTLLDENHWDWSVPNNFYYVVPKELVPVAVEYLEGTPYWIIEVWKYWRDWEYYCFDSKKKSKNLHKNKVSDRIIFNMAHRMSWICQKLVSWEQ